MLSHLLSHYSFVVFQQPRTVDLSKSQGGDLLRLSLASDRPLFPRLANVYHPSSTHSERSCFLSFPTASRSNAARRYLFPDTLDTRLSLPILSPLDIFPRSLRVSSSVDILSLSSLVHFVVCSSLCLVHFSCIYTCLSYSNQGQFLFPFPLVPSFSSQ